MAQQETKDSTSEHMAAPTPTTDTPAATTSTSDAVVPASKEEKEPGERKARLVVEYIGGEETDEEPEEGGEDNGDPATEDLLAIYPDDTEVRISMLPSSLFLNFTLLV